MRCPSRHEGARCDLERGHRGRHERGGPLGPEPHLTWTALKFDEDEVYAAAVQLVTESNYCPRDAGIKILDILRAKRRRS